MEIKEIDFKSIKITFEFQNKNFTIQAEPFKTFEEIKKKVLNKFIDLPFNIHFYYKGKDLSKEENEKIGTIFNNKEQVKIILRLPTIKLKANGMKNESFLKGINKNKLLDSPEQNSEHSLLNTQFIPIKSRNKIFNLKLLKKPDYDKKINDNNNSFKLINKISKNKFLKGSSSMPNLNSKNSFIKDEYTFKNRINFGQNFDIYNNISFCENHKYKVGEYCRNCKKFICPECRLNEEHKNHLTLQLNFKNLEESIKLYTILIQTNETKNLEIINKNFNSNENEIIKYENLNERQNLVSEKCDILIKNYESIMTKIQKKMSTEKKNYKTTIINTFNDIAIKISKQIGEIVYKLDEVMKKKDKKLSIDELLYFLNEIAEKEETLKFIGDTTLKYLLTWEIHKKIETAFDKIENTLDEIINEEKPFNLDKKYNDELIKIINQSDSNNKSDKKEIKGILRKKGQRRNGLVNI